LKTLDEGAAAGFTEAVLAVTTLPQPFLLPKLQAMANAKAHEQRWDRRQALEGLARLDTPAAWDSITSIAQGGRRSVTPRAAPDDSLRAYAVLLLGEKVDATFLPTLLEMVSSAPPELRGSVLRALGFFHDPRANQVLFARLHSARPDDRVNAILGLKNLEAKDAIPALMAMLNDPEAQVRQVAHFALQSLTGLKFELSPQATRAESARVAERWHAWWREQEATFVPVRQPPCHDW
jgi:HEAT repeat protein